MCRGSLGHGARQLHPWSTNPLRLCGLNVTEAPRQARIRAFIVTLKNLVSNYLVAQDYEFDWCGRFWARGCSILAQVDNKKPTDGAHLLLDMRGSETSYGSRLRRFIRIFRLIPMLLRAGLGKGQ